MMYFRLGTNYLRTLAVIWVGIFVFWGCSCENNKHSTASTDKELTSFSFESVHNADLAADVLGEITGTEVRVTVPFGTDLTALKASFAITGVWITVGGMEQSSGATMQDFSDSVVYTVHAEDGSSTDYTVTVTAAAIDAKEITRFTILGIDGTITGTDIHVTVPSGTDRTSLAPTVVITGVSVSPASGAAQDFSASETTPVTYTVTAADGSTQAYAVTVVEEVVLSDAKEITSFSFPALLNGGAGLAQDATAAIVDNNILVTVNFGTDVTHLKAAFVTTGDAVTIAGTPQASTVTENDFSSPLTYRVQAQDGTTRDYLVTVIVASSSSRDLTSFSFLAANNPGLAADVVGVISGTDVTVVVPSGTDLINLIATFTTTGASVAADDGLGPVVQTSGVTAVDFSIGSVTYVVSAANGLQKFYSVTVLEALASDADLLAFGFLSANNPGLSSDASGVIVEGTTGAIDVIVPFGTNPASLRASFTTSGVSVTVSGAAQVSGVTSTDFTGPVTYRVYAADGSFKDYIVTVQVAPSSAREITSFSFRTAQNPFLVATVTGAITDGFPGTIELTVPFGTPVTGLVATFVTNGVRVSLDGLDQLNTVTSNDFTSPRTYTVHAVDGSTRQYLVSVTVAAHSPPTVVRTLPVNDAVKVNARATFTLTFSERMKVSTLTANTTNSNCAGYNIAVSADNFATCVRLKNFTTTNNPTITFQPRNALTTRTVYQVRILGPGGVQCEDFSVNMASDYVFSFTVK